MLWRNLRHQNVLPLLGATMTEYQFVTVSEWMNHGNINEFLRWNSDANRLELVSSFLALLIGGCLHPMIIAA